ncbi:MAG: transglutaminase domain-containing protein [candidate division Zixibacteria bacterium]|nr:transglutaminase domain-containing protein [candidate division Zixibacteria bacterium]
MRNLKIINSKIRRLLLLSGALFFITPAYADSLLFNDNMYGSEWYGIYMGRNKIGYSKSVFEKIGENKWSISTSLTLTFKVNEIAASIGEVEQRIYEGDNGEMTSIDFSSANPTGDISVIGKTISDSFMISTNIAGRLTSKFISRPAETLTDAMIIPIKAQNGLLVVGDTLRFSTFLADPPLSSRFNHLAIVKSRETILFAGIPTDIYMVYDSTLEMNIGGEIIVTDKGRIIEQRAAGMAIITRAEPEEIAKQIDLEFDLLSHNVIACDSGPIDAGSVKKASFLITGFDNNKFPAASNFTIEKFSPDSALVTIFSEPYDHELSAIPDSLQRYLEPEQLIQSKDPEITKLAEEILDNERNPKTKAELINRWVYLNIKKEYSPEISNALATLRARKGDCGEHSALAVALLRASGIPARVASGVVYWPEGKGFAYHAWVELYLGKWVQMDPTWNELSANATHIMLTNGGVEKQIAVIAAAIRGMKIKFVSFE